MAIEEGAWAVCVCISYTGDGGQLRCSFLWSGRGGWGGQGNCRKVIGQMINEVTDRCNIYGGMKMWDGGAPGVVANDVETFGL